MCRAKLEVDLETMRLADEVMVKLKAINHSDAMAKLQKMFTEKKRLERENEQMKAELDDYRLFGL